MLDNGVITTAKGAKPRRQAAQGQSSESDPGFLGRSGPRPLDRAGRGDGTGSDTGSPAQCRNANGADDGLYGRLPAVLPVANANKFTGKAVTFLQIAKFNPTSGM